MSYSDNEHLHGYTTTLEFSTDGGSTWTFVNDLASVEGPEAQFKESDNTTLKSPNKVILATPGWQEVGDFKFQVYGHKTQGWGTLYTAFLSGATTAYEWRVTCPKLSTESVSGGTFVAT